MVRRVMLWIWLLSAAALPVAASEPLHSEDDYRAIEVLTDVLILVRDNYVEQVDVDELIRGAVKGVFDVLDPHSSYLDPDMYADFKADTQGVFGGIGIELAVRERKLTVIAPMEGTPAERAGIRAGDQIVAIDGVPAHDLDMLAAVRLLRGAAGAQVTLTLIRTGTAEPFDVVLVRDLIRIQSVRSRLIDGRYGYLRLNQFQEQSAQDAKEHLAELQSQSANGLGGLILDLRNNPGGLLDQAVAVADLFLKEGTIVSIAGRHPDSREVFSARDDATEGGYPLVVLINGGSASAAEIVAGALQDHQRAILLGEQSFGKGSVQSIIPLDDDAGLRLTTAHYFTPEGRMIQALGITPDIAAPQAYLSLHPVTSGMREQDLQGHLPPERPLLGNSSTKVFETSSEDQQLMEDYQLQRALDLLKGFSKFIGKSAY